jgi:hypothetical protein
MSELEFDALELEAAPDLPTPSEPPSPPATPCIICADCDLYDHAPPSLEDGAQLAEPWTLRCKAHAGICRGCYKPGVTDGRKDNCPTCAVGQFVCIVCVVMHCAYEHGDPINQPIAIGQKRCFRHQGWCAGCMKFSVESDAEDVCAKCKRDGYRAAHSPADVDVGQLKREKFLCFHATPTACRSPGQWDCVCGCDCYWCNNRYGWAQPYGPPKLPPPPTAEQDARQKMMDYLMGMSREEWLAEMRGLWAAPPPKAKP